MDRLEQAFFTWRKDTARAQYHNDPHGRTALGREARDELCRIAIERAARRG